MSGSGIGEFAIGISPVGGPSDTQTTTRLPVGDDVMEYGWAGSGQYLTSPIVALSTELDNLQPSSGDVLAISPPFSNNLGAILCDVEFIAGGPISPVQDAFLEVWIIRSLDGGQSFWDGSATAAPARGADITIAIPAGSGLIPHSGEPGLVLPPGSFKLAVRNQTGAAIPAGSKLRFSEYGEASLEDGLSGLSGDASGTQAYRIADMMERFGVVTYSQADLSVNPWGAGVSDYTSSSVIQALTWLTANSGMRCNVREYHQASQAAQQLIWAPAVNAATGSKFDISLLRGATSADAASLIQIANTSANSTGWLTWAEGLNTPNDGSVTAATAVSIQQSLYSGCVGTRSLTFPVTPVGPSFSYTTYPPNQDASVTGYLDSSQKASLLAATSIASARFFPPLNPDADDSAGRGGISDDVALSQTVYYGKPTIIGEWHPTSGNTDSPSHATDDSFAAYYAVLAMLNFHRLGVEAWFWKSLFDIGQSGDSPFVRVGLFPNRGSDIPRLPARAIRAMYSLTGDTGSSRRSFMTSKLDLTVSGLPSPVSNATPWTGGHWRLFQNSGGTFFLFVWNEQRTVGGTGTSVTITFAKAMAQVLHYDLTTDSTTAETAIETPTNVTSLSFSLAASVHLFVILPQGSAAAVESAQNTTLTTSSGVIYDSTGTAWSLVYNPPFGNQVRHGSVIDSQNIVLLLYFDHTVWQQNSSGNWSFWNGTSWVSASADPRIGQNESPSGTTVTGTGVTIFASQTPGQSAGASLDLWTLNSSAQAVLNGVADLTTSNVLQLYYQSHVLFRQETNGNVFGTPGWWSWGGSSWTAVPSPVGQSEATEGTLVTTVGPAIYASQNPGQTAGAGLDSFALNSSAQVVRNGIADTTTSNVTQLYYHNHVAFRQQSTGNTFGVPGWWSWNGTSWAESPSPISQTESTDRTTVMQAGGIIYASQTPGSTAGLVVDTWMILSSGQVSLNNVVDTSKSNVLQLHYVGHTVYVQTQGGNSIGDTPGWFKWNGSGWTDVHTPIPVAQTVTLSSITQQLTGQSFTVSGTLTGNSVAPSLQYQDNTGSFASLPSSFVSATGFSFTHPSFGSAGSNSVNVRYSTQTSIQNRSNTFSVVNAASVTITAVQLSGSTIVAGSLAGTPIGVLSAVATGGSFTGSFTVDDTAHFKVIGNRLLSSTTLAVGNYPITVNAVMTGATGSPKSQSFTISAVSGGNVTVNLSSPTGKTLKKALFGFSINSADGNTWFPNATFKSTAALNCQPALLHVHPDWDLPSAYASGNMTQVNAFLQNYRAFCQSDVRVIMGMAPDTSVSAATHASRAATFAAYLNNNGFSDILDWEVGFEWGETGSGIPLSTVVTYFTTIADALHNVNSNYRVWGPPQNGPNSYDTTSFANQVGSKCYGVLYHSYDIAADTNRNITDTLDTVYGAKGQSSPDATIQRNALAGTPLASAPIGILEYNLAYSNVGGVFQSVNECSQYLAAVWASLFLVGQFQSTTGVEAAALKSLVGADAFGAIANSQEATNPANTDPQGYFLGKAGRSLYGAEYFSSTTILKFLACSVKPTANTFAFLLVNWDQASDRTVNLALTGGVPSGAILRWELNRPAKIIYPTLGTFTDSSGNVWTLNSGGNPVINGLTDTASHAVLAFVVGSTVWQQDQAGDWYSLAITGTISSVAGLPWQGPAASPPSQSTAIPLVSLQPGLGAVTVNAESIVILTGTLS